MKEIILQSKAKSSKGRRYSPSWLLNCLLLHIRGPKTYRFLRESEILPLPCKSTIIRYLKKSNTGVGFDEEFFDLFKKKLDQVDAKIPGSRHGLIYFDEMQVRTSLGVNIKDITFDGLIDFGPGVDASKKIKNKPNNDVNSVGMNVQPAETSAPQNLGDSQADHALVYMFSSLKASFHQPIGVFASKIFFKNCFYRQ